MDLSAFFPKGSVLLDPDVESAIRILAAEINRRFGTGAQRQPLSYRVLAVDLGTARDLLSNDAYPLGPKITIRARGFWVAKISDETAAATLRAGLATNDPIPLVDGRGFEFEDFTEEWFIENVQQAGISIYIIFYG
jgi:hypothetical protein